MAVQSAADSCPAKNSATGHLVQSKATTSAPACTSRQLYPGGPKGNLRNTSVAMRSRLTGSAVMVVALRLRPALCKKRSVQSQCQHRKMRGNNRARIGFERKIAVQQVIGHPGLGKDRVSLGAQMWQGETAQQH